MMSLKWFSNMRVKEIFVIAAGLLASELAWILYRKYGRVSNEEGSPNKKALHEVMFFTEQSSNCRPHLISRIPCTMSSCPISHLNKLAACLGSAKRSIDICVYILTCYDLVKVIIDAHRRNVAVRLITDDESSGSEASQIFKMRTAGIRVRGRRTDFLMHHKFAVIDRNILIVGSANWTTQAFFGNCENVMITNQKELMNAYANEFEKLWLKFEQDSANFINNGAVRSDSANTIRGVRR